MLALRLRRAHSSSFATSPKAVRSIMTSTKTDGRSVKFGPFEVTKQVFLSTPHSFGLVNLKPILPGHVLVCPHTPHRRLTDLSAAEVADLFETVQLTQRLMARAYFPAPGEPEVGSFTVAVQDGAEAGQTVPHVHVHVIPRVAGDLGSTPDAVYVKMAGEEGNVGGALWDHAAALGQRPVPGGGFPKVDDEDRHPRNAEDMVAEVQRYQNLLRSEFGLE